ncbi:unnamed protein product [Mucor hiemalis]
MSTKVCKFCQHEEIHNTISFRYYKPYSSTTVNTLHKVMKVANHHQHDPQDPNCEENFEHATFFRLMQTSGIMPTINNEYFEQLPPTLQVDEVEEDVQIPQVGTIIEEEDVVILAEEDQKTTLEGGDVGAQPSTTIPTVQHQQTTQSTVTQTSVQVSQTKKLSAPQQLQQQSTTSNYSDDLIRDTRKVCCTFIRPHQSKIYGHVNQKFVYGCSQAKKDSVQQD